MSMAKNMFAASLCICPELVKERHKIDNAVGKNAITAAAGKPKAAANKNKRAQLQLNAK